MKLFTDYHSHPQAHRLQPYTLDLLQPWADSARAKGLRDIAFTDHDRYHEGVDLDAVDRLREANPDLAIRAGIELDNDPVTAAAGRAWVEKHWHRLDFVLGSVHYLDASSMFDAVGQDVQFAERDIDTIYADYFARVRRMVKTGLVDCLSHLDLIKIHGHRPDTNVAALAGETLALIKERDLAMEISTAGWRKPVGEQYPSAEIIRLALDAGIPMTIASDAHSHVQLAENYERLGVLLESLGVKEVCIYENHRRRVLAL